VSVPLSLHKVTRGLANILDVRMSLHEPDLRQVQRAVANGQPQYEHGNCDRESENTGGTVLRVTHLLGREHRRTADEHVVEHLPQLGAVDLAEHSQHNLREFSAALVLAVRLRADHVRAPRPAAAVPALLPFLSHAGAARAVQAKDVIGAGAKLCVATRTRDAR
jgi:hypothetical protein